MTTKLYESLQREADEILMYDEDYKGSFAGGGGILR